MTKQQIPAPQLVDAINKELASRWPHKNHPCRVISLQEATSLECNWVVDAIHDGGLELSHKEECDELRRLVLEELASQYDVQWP